MSAPRILSLADLERAARRRLPASVFGYVSGGSEDGSSLDGNRAAFARWRFLTRPLVDVSARSQSAELFGTRFAAPLGISPMGASVLCGFDADCALAAAARLANVPFVLSAASTTPLERVAKVNPDMWYQAYLPARTEVIDPLLERLRRAAVRVLVVTVDVPIASTRENEIRNGFSLPLRPSPRLILGGLARPRWLAGTFARTLLQHGVPHFENFAATRGGPIVTAMKGDHRAGRAALTWEHIRHIRKAWPGTLLLKGILRPEDALAALRAGADGIFVSNHGGRQLDGALAPLDALPAIAHAVAGSGLKLILDGGIRRGTDVLKALALGADAAFCGRPLLYGLATGGRALAQEALEVLKREIDVNLALLGCPDVAALDPSYLCAIGAPAMLASAASMATHRHEHAELPHAA
ncbi:alpha-hydroxy acid oxidase [Cupriavidus sp. 2TAF22]|uniref:alpha-hydroxy acid oxidase n=1 Tax=unclassified Cupriavidus TaxID=2640874 RepID=UPI003F926801